MRPRQLYRGFVPSLIGSHQLLIMASVNQGLHEKMSAEGAAVCAGFVSAWTITPFDGWAVRRQLGLKPSFPGPKVLFRGFMPTVLRQVGLSSGMYVFPHWFHRRKEGKPSGFVSFASGMGAAVLTHFPDTVRVIMQNDPSLSLAEACRMAFSRMKSKGCVVSCAMRMQVLAIAFTVMRWGREEFPKFLKIEEESK